MVIMQLLLTMMMMMKVIKKNTQFVDDIDRLIHLTEQDGFKIWNKMLYDM